MNIEERTKKSWGAFGNLDPGDVFETDLGKTFMKIIVPIYLGLGKYRYQPMGANLTNGEVVNLDDDLVVMRVSGSFCYHY